VRPDAIVCVMQRFCTGYERRASSVVVKNVVRPSSAAAAAAAFFFFFHSSISSTALVVAPSPALSVPSLSYHRTPGAMRRNEPRASSRSERIIHQGDAQYRPRAAAHLPRSRAKILEVDESTTASQVLAYEESVRHHFALDQFGHVGADVSEAASAWSAGREHGRREVEVPTAPRKPFSVDPKRIPKPLRHLLAGAFSGGALPRATAGTRTAASSRGGCGHVASIIGLTLEPRHLQDGNRALGVGPHEADGLRV